MCLGLAASANQMISGSVVIFAAILSKLFLDRQLNKLHYAGCACGTLTRGQCCARLSRDPGMHSLQAEACIVMYPDAGDKSSPSHATSGPQPS